MPSNNAAHLDRVTRRIADSVLAFWASSIDTSWHADQLREFVEQRVGHVAPGSADRVLRSLRAQGALDYEVVNRKASLYRWRTSGRLF